MSNQIKQGKQPLKTASALRAGQAGVTGVGAPREQGQKETGVQRLSWKESFASARRTSAEAPGRAADLQECEPGVSCGTGA